MKLRSSGSCRCDEENDQSALHLLLFCPDMMVESNVRKIKAFLEKESRPLNENEISLLKNACKYICKVNSA